MIMIPLPFLLAGLALAVLVLLWDSPSPRREWLQFFLALVVFQEVLIGTRFGYGWSSLRFVQPFSAALLPPLAYLSFTRPQLTPKTALHLLPLGAVTFLILFFLDWLDVVLSLNNLVYAALLVAFALKGPDALEWARLSQTRVVTGWIWVVVAGLMVSGITDAAISYDFLVTQGDNTRKIASLATGIGLLIIAAILSWQGVSRSWSKTQEDADPRSQTVFADLETLMAKELLFVDPDINLSRIARRMRLPARDVSRAINRCANQNASQFVNGLRVKEACRLLRNTDKQITEIALASGFNSKSNFNREFLRIVQETPSNWRARPPK
ncbi:MAG: helix-turn-helix transcriptional regulator [Rhodobacteraceae bacterium]|nr:helix-turn-helix transcriptional regulator [Paracoccaceae bacterium]